MKNSFSVLFVYYLLSISSYSNCEIINVPDDYSTIQAGINASSNGDTVLVDTGTYNVHITINKKITLASIFLTTANENYIKQTIIDPNSAGRAVVINDDCCLIGFTIKNSSSSHLCTGIYASDCSINIQNNFIVNNQARGVNIMRCSAMLKNNIICNNGQNGVHIEQGYLYSVNNTIVNNGNTGYPGFGYGIYIGEGGDDKSSGVIANTIVYNNEDGNINGWPDPVTYNCQFNDPSFINPSNGIGPNYDALSADWHLQASSPCIDAGAEWSRKDYDGSIADIGAFTTTNFAGMGDLPTNSLSGNISGTLSGEVNIIEDIIISEGNTLNISPGTILNCVGGGINIFGNLIANGTISDSVKFIGLDATYSNGEFTGRWKGIEFKNSNTGSNEMNYCRITDSGETGIYLNNSTIEINNSNISYNICPTGSKNAAGVTCKNNSDLSIYNSKINHNLTGYDSHGGISSYNSFINIENCEIIHNVHAHMASESAGSGIMVWDSDVNIKNNVLGGNENGNAIAINHDCRGEVKNNKIYNTHSGGNHSAGIGLIEISSENLKINNNLIFDNSHEGIQLYANCYNGNFNCNIISNTIYNNGEGIAFYGIGSEVNYDITLLNNIIWNNSIQIDIYLSGGASINPNFEFCDIQNGTGEAWLGIGCIDQDPLFINSEDGDFHLQDTSPCIRAATADGCPIRDIEGTQRGNPPDIGAYENIADGDQSLPVELINLSAKYDEGCVIISWITASETNILGFELYKKDYLHEEYILLSSYKWNKNLASSGNSTSIKKYRFIDNQVENGKTYFYRLIQVDISGKKTEFEPVSVNLELNKDEEKLDSYILFQNYPNPFNSQTQISFQVPKYSYISLKVFDLQGKKIVTLTETMYESGNYRINWNGKDNFGNPVSSGIYFYQLNTKELFYTKKLILIR